MHAANYTVTIIPVSGLMILEAGGMLLIGCGYFRAPSYAFEMTWVAEIGVLKTRCNLTSVHSFASRADRAASVVPRPNVPDEGYLLEPAEIRGARIRTTEAFLATVCLSVLAASFTERYTPLSREATADRAEQ